MKPITCGICNKKLNSNNKSGYCQKHKHLSEEYKVKKQKQNKKYYQKHKENIKEYHKQWYEENKEKKIEKNKEYNEEHKEKIAIYRKSWEKQNKDKRLEYHKNYNKNKRDFNKEFKIKESISASIRKNLKKLQSNKKYSTQSYADISLIISYLESQFDEHMNWENYGSYWHIDHIIPQSLFDFTNEEQIKLCWNYKNLRPLKAVDNIVKKNTLQLELIKKYNLENILEKIEPKRYKL